MENSAVEENTPISGIKYTSLTETYNRVVSVRRTWVPDWIDDEDEDFDQLCCHEA